MSNVDCLRPASQRQEERGETEQKLDNLQAILPAGARILRLTTTWM